MRSRARQSGRAALFIELARNLQSSRIDLKNRVEARTLLVVRLDAVEIELNKSLVCECSGGDCALNVRDASGAKVELPLFLSEERRSEREEEEEEVRKSRSLSHWVTLRIAVVLVLVAPGSPIPGAEGVLGDH